MLLVFPVSRGQQAANLPALGSATLAKRQARRFLAERGLVPGQRNVRQAAASVQTSAQTSTRRHALAAAVSVHAEDTSLATAWQAVGPAQVSTADFGLVTGRITALAADPSDATGNTLYVGSTGGGVWKSTNAAGAVASAAFTPLTDTLPAYATSADVSLSIGALTVQPGGTGVVLAGTGDPNDAANSYYGAGILRSADGGVTWSLISGSDDVAYGGNSNSTFFGNSFAGFAWSTVSPATVVAAVTSSTEGALVNAQSGSDA
ncbi:MAG: hypothetical protein QM649_19415, partial [Silvibacterium sp.]